MNVGLTYAPPALRPAAQAESQLGAAKLPKAGDFIGELPEPGRVGTKPGGFEDLLQDAVQTASDLGHIAGAKSKAFAMGTFDDMHGTMISAQEANISLKLVGSVRSKLLEAFNELWRIHV